MASGTIKRRTIKAAPLASSNDPSVFPMKDDSDGAIYDSCLHLTTRGIWQERGVGPLRRPKIAFGFRCFSLKAASGTSNMPEIDFRAPRLFIDAALTAGGNVELQRNPRQHTRH